MLIIQAHLRKLAASVLYGRAPAAFERTRRVGDIHAAALGF